MVNEKELDGIVWKHKEYSCLVKGGGDKLRKALEFC